CAAAAPFDPSPILSNYVTAGQTVPVMVTEFGWPSKTDGTYIANVISFAEAQGWGWSVFAWDGKTGGQFDLLSSIGPGKGYEPNATADPAVIGFERNAVVPITGPGLPTNVTATGANGSATVAWLAPSSSGGSPITGYTVTASPGGATVTTAANATSAVLALTNGASYTFTVHATNGVGDSPESVPSNSVTPVAPSITVRSPNGGELWRLGTSQAVTW